MHLDIALLADAATVDAAGKLNILGAFHRLRGARFPLRHGRLALVLRFVPESDDRTGEGVGVEVRLLGPEDDVILRLDGKVQARSGDPPPDVRIPQVLNLDGIVFPTGGTYRFVVEVDGAEVGRVPLKVEKGATGGGAQDGGGGSPTPVMVPPGSEGGVRA